MKDLNLKDKVLKNKQKMLDWHTDFYKAIDKVKAQEKSSRELIENLDKFVTNDNKVVDFSEIFQYIMMKKVTGSINEIFGNMPKF